VQVGRKLLSERDENFDTTNPSLDTVTSKSEGNYSLKEMRTLGKKQPETHQAHAVGRKLLSERDENPSLCN